MTAWTETYRGMVCAWHCDHQGHMTTMHYVGMFDQAGWMLMSLMGFGAERLRAESRGFVDVRATYEYRAELVAGCLLRIESGVARIGGSSITYLNRMSNVETGELAATSEVTTVFFDLDARTKAPLPEEARAALARFQVEPEAE